MEQWKKEKEELLNRLYGRRKEEDFGY